MSMAADQICSPRTSMRLPLSMSLRSQFSAAKYLRHLAATLGLLLHPLCIATMAGEPVRLPDTEITRFGAYTGWLIDPTTRYAHAVLGDAVEAGGFVVERNGQRLIFRLGRDAVFEDLRLRFADLDGDGVPEIIIVKSYLTRGSAIAVYKIGANAIEPLAESEAVGTANRWLNPVGVADFTGSGEVMIAAIITPHLTGSLRLYRLAGNRLVETVRKDGYTNHVIDSRNLDLAHLVDIDGDGVTDIVIPTVDRRHVAAVSFAGGVAREIGRRQAKGRIEALAPRGHGAFTATTRAGTAIIRFKGRR